MIKTSLRELIEENIGTLRTADSASTGLMDISYTAVSTDSREVSDGTIFIAIKGQHVDGHDFVVKLPEGSLAVVDHYIENARVPQLVVDDTVKALGRIAHLNIAKRRDCARRGVNEFTVIAITGSVGKTTTKDMLAAILSKLAPTVSPVGSFNNDIGLPLTALKVNEKTRFLVAEMGASAVGEIAYLTSIVRPDIAIVLKVGVAHLGGFGSVERIRDAKAELVESLTSSGVAVLNADDENVQTMAKRTKASNIIWFSRHDEVNLPKPTVSGMVSSVIIRGVNCEVDESNRAKFTVELPDNSRFDLRLGIPGEHNVYNALAALSVIYSLDIPEHYAASALSYMTHISPHRMHVARVNIEGTHFTVIDDSFNANPDSMRAGLNALKTFDGTQSTLERVAVLGSMLELGDGEEEAHRFIGKYAADCADVVIAVGVQSDDNLMRLASCIADGAQGARAQVKLVKNIDEAHDVVSDLAVRKDCVVLLKGSHASGLSGLATRWLASEEK